MTKHGKQDKMRTQKQKEERTVKVKTAKGKSNDAQRNKNNAN